MQSLSNFTPSGNHFNPNTRIWCCSICKNEETLALVCKLPPKPLPGSSLYHEAKVIVPRNFAGAKVREITSYEDFLKAIESILLLLKKRSVPVYFKGYGKEYNYDKDLLKANFNKYGLSDDSLEVLKNAYELRSFEDWKETSNQIKKGTFVPNQRFFFAGLQHCIEDAEQLYKHIKK